MGSSTHPHGLVRLLVILLQLLLLVAVISPWTAFAQSNNADTDDSSSTCADQLAAADLDTNGELEAAEYGRYLQSRFPNCTAYNNANNNDELSAAQELAFETTACSLCLLEMTGFGLLRSARVAD